MTAGQIFWLSLILVYVSFRIHDKKTEKGTLQKGDGLICFLSTGFGIATCLICMSKP